LKIVNALFQCNRRAAIDQNVETQPVESLLLNEWEINFFPFLHRDVHITVMNLSDCGHAFDLPVPAKRVVVSRIRRVVQPRPLVLLEGD